MARAKLSTLEIGGSLQLSRRGHKYLGDQRIRLLEAIERTGSIAQAAREVELSYKAAWDAVDAMNNLSERPLLVRSTGGAGGGGSQLTEHARELVRLYRLLDGGYRRLLRQMQAQIHDFDRLSDFLRAIAVKTSARNQYRGTVTDLQRGAVNAEVRLDIGDGLALFANITNDAVDDLRLAPGREATALIKSSFVMLGSGSGLRVSARNQLQGTVAQLHPGAVNSEVVLQLAAARRLTAIVTNDAVADLQLAVGSACCALIKASHVILAVND